MEEKEAVQYVQIIRFEDDHAIETMGPMSEWKADRVDRGVNINLNHEAFYTLIVTKDKLRPEVQT